MAYKTCYLMMATSDDNKSIPADGKKTLRFRTCNIYVICRDFFISFCSFFKTPKSPCLMHLSILTFTRNFKRARSLCPHVLFFLLFCIAKYVNSICFSITISIHNCKLTFLDNGWLVKTFFNSCFRSLAALRITVLIVISIVNIHYRA